MPDFPNAQTGGEHQAEQGFKFGICNSRKEDLHFLPGGNKGQIGVEFSEWELVRIPWLAQDIKGKKAQLGNTVVDGTVRKMSFLLDPADKIPEFSPGNVFRGYAQNIRKISQVNRDISRISSECMVCKAAEGDHLPVLF